MATQHAEVPLRLERFASVIARTGRSRSAIHRDIAAGAFPQPIKIGLRSIAFDAAEVDAWIAQRIAARDAKGAQS